MLGLIANSGRRPMSVDPQLLSQFIARIYDAALDPALWPDVLEQTCIFLDGTAAAIYTQDIALRSGTRYLSWGDLADYTERYFSYYVRINPLVPHFMSQGVGEVYCASTLMPYDELRASRFFREWAVPQGLVDFVGTTLDKTARSVATLSVGRNGSQGLADAAAQDRMLLLAPHFRRAVLIGNLIDLQRVETETLNGLSSAVFLLDANRRIIFVNVAGQHMLEQRSVLTSMNGVLAAINSAADRSLHRLCSAAAMGDATLGTGGIALPLPGSDGNSWIAHLLPLTSGARQQSTIAHQAKIALFAREAAADISYPLETIAARFDLTPTECRVLNAVVESGGVPAAADALGMSPGTVRTHLHHLFGKTGARRQSDLVKMMAAYASPFVSP